MKVALLEAWKGPKPGTLLLNQPLLVAGLKVETAPRSAPKDGWMDVEWMDRLPSSAAHLTWEGKRRGWTCGHACMQVAETILLGAGVNQNTFYSCGNKE